MKTSTIRKYALLSICLFLSCGFKAQDVKLTLTITQGSLSYYLGDQIDTVTDLTLIGEINGWDVNTIRNMSSLTKLDMANIDIKAGGFFYLGRYIFIEDDKIPASMFFSMSNLTSVILPTNIIDIGNQAFQDCSGLTSISIPTGVSAIDTLVFANCSGLKTFVVPNHITAINSRAFWGCTGLTSVTIPASVSSVGKSAFAICTGLKEFIVSESNPIVSSVDGVLFSKDKTKLIAYPNAKSSIYTVPVITKSIDEYAFESCSGLGSVVIGDNVTSLGDGVFYNCTGLSYVTIGNSVTSIKTNTFYNCNNLTSVVIPNSVTSIGWDAFGYCSKLSSLDLGNGITSIDIYAFTYCTALSYVILPASLKSIAGWAFSYCTGLNNIYSKAVAPPSITSTTFNNVDKNVCNLFVPIGSYSSYKSATGWSDFKYINEIGTSIPQLNVGDIKVYAEQDAIIVNGASLGNVISVYDTAGALVQSIKVTDDITRIYVPKNRIYMVRVTSKTFKVAL